MHEIILMKAPFLFLCVYFISFSKFLPISREPLLVEFYSQNANYNELCNMNRTKDAMELRL